MRKVYPAPKKPRPEPPPQGAPQKRDGPKPSDSGIVVTVVNCARCGRKHVNLEFALFTQPCGRNTHWAVCPVVYEPILLRMVPETDT